MSDNYPLFNINQTDNITNKDIIVTITPKEGITKYDYTIIKNNERLQTVSVDNGQIDILLNQTGTYQIEVIQYIGNNMEVEMSGVYQIDKDKPIINISEKNIDIQMGEAFNAYKYVSAYDELDGDLSKQITTNYASLDLDKDGMQTLVYTVSDRAGNTATEKLYINVLPRYPKPIVFFNMIIILILFLFLLFLLRYSKSIKLEKRIAKYAISPLHDNSLSLFDKFFVKYHYAMLKVSTFFEKSVFLTKYSKGFEKYLGIVNKTYTKPMEFIVSKVFIGFIFLLIAIFSKALQGEVFSLYEIAIPLIVGFFIPDIIYFSKYKVYRAKLENDMLQAIIIMNNAFKSGRSISQAIDLVADELEGPISEEFKKMALELSFGLSIEDVFKRFSKRIELEEVNYLTASLSVLNKTGGNIIKVFSSIEKTLFNQKKLRLELKSLTGASKIIVYILFVVPILFIAFISFIDPSYFVPLLTTPLGFMISSIILVVYIIYIFVVRKVMKVRM